MSFKKMLLFILSLLILAGGVYGYLIYFEGEKPVVVLNPNTKFVGPLTKFELVLRDNKQGLRLVQVWVEQNKRIYPILTQKYQHKHWAKLKFSLPAQNLKPGKCALLVDVFDCSWRGWGQGNNVLLKREVIYDPNPPVITLLTRVHNLNQGGSGLLIFKSNEPLLKAGIQLGADFFPAYYDEQKKRYTCLFAWPYYTQTSLVPRLIAIDLAHNKAKVGFYYHLNRKNFSHDNINISDRFLQTKMVYFQKYFPQVKDYLQLFLKVNRELRKENRFQLRELAKDTVPRALFQGVFKRLPNSAQRASFAQFRTYFYHGKVIDHQVHLGLDLASIARAKVPAANNGRVIFAGEMGIYGQVIIIDHGLGLQTLYAHLSEFDVQKGQTVHKGQIIGRTGSTGLAGGDHLHFAVIVSGIPVNPIEWLDPHWLKNNIYNKLNIQ